MNEQDHATLEAFDALAARLAKLEARKHVSLSFAHASNKTFTNGSPSYATTQARLSDTN